MSATPTLVLYRESDYALSLLYNVEPTPLDEYSLPYLKCATLDELTAYLKEYDALSWAAFKVLAPVVIVKPGWGVVATVQPLPPLARIATIRIARHPKLSELAKGEASFFSSLYDDRTAVIPTDTPYAMEIANVRIDELWKKADDAHRDHELDRLDRIRERIDLLSWLSAEIDKAFTEGAAYLVVQA